MVTGSWCLSSASSRARRWSRPPIAATGSGERQKIAKRRGGAGASSRYGKETRDSSDGNRVYHASSTGLIVGLCVGAAVLVIVLAVVVRKLRGRAAEETSTPQLDAEVQVEA